MDRIEKIANRITALERIARNITAIGKYDAGEHKFNSGSNHPAVYVGTYGKYNMAYPDKDPLGGAWVDLTTFKDWDEFEKWCKTTLHSDEKDPEIMFQDTANIPKCFVESQTDSLKPEVFDYIDLIKENDLDKGYVDAILEHSDDGNLEDVENAFYYPNCTSLAGAALEMHKEGGDEIFTDDFWRECFDYEQYAIQYLIEADDEQREEFKGMTDSEVGEHIVDSYYGGIDKMDMDTVREYCDYDEVARRLQDDGKWISYDSGYIFVPKR